MSMPKQPHDWQVTHGAGGRVDMRCTRCRTNTNNALLASIYSECPGAPDPNSVEPPSVEDEARATALQVQAETMLSVLFARALLSLCVYALAAVVFGWVVWRGFLFGWWLAGLPP